MNKYQAVSVPKEFLNDVKKAVETGKYVSIADFVRCAIRNELRNLVKRVI